MRRVVEHVETPVVKAVIPKRDPIPLDVASLTSGYIGKSSNFLITHNMLQMKIWDWLAFSYSNPFTSRQTSSPRKFKRLLRSRKSCTRPEEEDILS
jgi:hypothetical protein